MKYSTFLATLLAAWLLSSCAPYGRDSGDSPRLAAERQIYLAVIGRPAAQPPTLTLTPIKVLFVSLGQQSEQTDPDPSLLLLVPHSALAIEPFSACDFLPSAIVDHRTGARGLVLQLGPIRWENDDQANLTATTWLAQGLGQMQVHHLTLKNGQWTIQQSQPLGPA